MNGRSEQRPVAPGISSTNVHRLDGTLLYHRVETPAVTVYVYEDGATTLVASDDHEVLIHDVNGGGAISIVPRKRT